MQNDAVNTVGHPVDAWKKARALAKELSAALAECEGATWYAQILPTGSENAVSFEAMPMANEQPIDKAERLAADLSITLVDYLEGKFYAAVLPAEPDGALPVAFINRQKMPNEEPYELVRNDAFMKLTPQELAYFHIKQAARAFKRIHNGEPVQFAIAEDYKSAAIYMTDRTGAPL